MSLHAAVLAIALGALPGGPLAEGPAPAETRHPLRARCALNLLDIGKALQTFALARDGMLPARLSELFVDTAGDRWRPLVCPATAPTPVEGGLYCTYAYVHAAPDGRELRPDARDVLAFDAEPLHQNGRNVLFSDMQVEYVPETDFQKLLAAERAKWQERGKTLDIVRDDFIPLTKEQLAALAASRRSFVQSFHFRVALALVLAIAAVAALLVHRSRRARSA